MKTTIKFPKSDSFAFLVTINKISKALDNAFFTVKENPDEEPVLQKKLGAGVTLADSRLYKNHFHTRFKSTGQTRSLWKSAFGTSSTLKALSGTRKKLFFGAN